MNGNIDRRLLRLHPADNVLTVISTLEPGDQICVGNGSSSPNTLEAWGTPSDRLEACVTVVKTRLPIGHKIAARSIAAGEKIVKYGAPIGSATAEIAAGEHVHTHNLKSDYLPTFLREDQARFFAQPPHP